MYKLVGCMFLHQYRLSNKCKIILVQIYSPQLPHKEVTSDGKIWQKLILLLEMIHHLFSYFIFWHENILELNIPLWICISGGSMPYTLSRKSATLSDFINQYCIKYILCGKGFKTTDLLHLPDNNMQHCVVS
jgi:hypothetical protein